MPEGFEEREQKGGREGEKEGVRKGEILRGTTKEEGLFSLPSLRRDFGVGVGKH
jgi:hypothetical protein